MSVTPAANWEAIARRYNLGEQAEWRKLLAHFDLAEGFALIVLLVPDADGAALCRRELERRLNSEGRLLHTIEFANPDDLHRLPENFLEISCDENTACLWIEAVVPDYAPDYAAWRRAWEHVLSRLNAHRNPIRDRFACTLVFAGAPWLQEVFREIAPDLWSIRTLVVRIEPRAQFSEAVMALQRIESSRADGPDPDYALEQAEKLRGVSGKELALADLLHRAAAGFMNRENWQEAEIAYSEAVELRERLGASPTNLLPLLDGWATACLGLGQPYYTHALATHAHAIALEVGDRRHELSALHNLGSAYYVLGETQRAISYYEKALIIAREIGDQHHEGTILGNLGIAYADLGETRRAIEFYEQALVIDHEIGDRRGEGADLGNLGSAYYSLGEVRRAIEFYEQYLAIAREIGDRRGEGNALWNMSVALNKLGEQARAIELAEVALRIYEQIEDPNAAKVRRRLEEWRGTASEHTGSNDGTGE